VKPLMFLAVIPFAFAVVAYADGPAGIKVPDADRTELEAGVAELGKEIESLRSTREKKSALLDLLPDLQIYYNTVRYALTYGEFFRKEELPVAKALLKQGMERARALKEGTAPWTTATGLVVRGYVSKIDGSVQPSPRRISRTPPTTSGSTFGSTAAART
jgi:hypothetical protein